MALGDDPDDHSGVAHGFSSVLLLLTLVWIINNRESVTVRCRAALTSPHVTASRLDALRDDQHCVEAVTTRGGAGALALLVDINALAQLVSIGTLFVFYMVDAGVLVRRYYEPGSGNWRALAARFAAMLAFNLGAVLCPSPPTCASHMAHGMTLVTRNGLGECF